MIPCLPTLILCTTVLWLQKKAYTERFQYFPTLTLSNAVLASPLLYSETLCPASALSHVDSREGEAINLREDFGHCSCHFHASVEKGLPVIPWKARNINIGRNQQPKLTQKACPSATTSPRLTQQASANTRTSPLDHAQKPEPHIYKLGKGEH